MSTYVRVELRCDHPGCDHVMTLERTNRGGLNITQAKTYAVAVLGWTVTAKRQLCPEHSR